MMVDSVIELNSIDDEWLVERLIGYGSYSKY